MKSLKGCFTGGGLKIANIVRHRACFESWYVASFNTYQAHPTNITQSSSRVGLIFPSVTALPIAICIKSLSPFSQLQKLYFPDFKRF